MLLERSTISGFLRLSSIRVALIVGIFFAIKFAPIPFPWRLPVLSLVALAIVFAQNAPLSEIGLRKHSFGATILWGIGLAAIAAIGIGEILQPLFENFTGIKTDYSAYGALEGNLIAALTLIGYAMLSAAIGEEILMRGFMIYQLTEVFGDKNAGRWITITIAGIIFGLAHYQQAWIGVIATGLVGLVFSWAFFRSKKNLWALMLAHALTDIYGVTMIYAGMYK